MSKIDSNVGILDENLLDGHSSPVLNHDYDQEKFDPPGCSAAPLKLRGLILLCICFLTFGSYWVFDTPGAIQKQMEEWFGPSYTNAENALLYSVYSWPNCILALFGGLIVDRVTGIRLGAIIFCSLIWIGQICFAFGVMNKTYWVCVVGRFIFGLGGESLTVVQNTFVIRWFSGPYIALVFGLVLAFARVGSSVNFAVTPTLAETGVPFSVWFGAGMCTLSLLMCILLVITDYAASHYVEKPKITSDNIQEQEALDAEAMAEAPSIKEILSFPKAAFILFFICCLFYQGVLAFYQVASLIMQETGRKFPAKTASFFLSIPNFVSIVASPSFGRLVDKKGYSVSFIIIASWTLLLCHVVFLANCYSVTNIHPAPIMFVLGLAYALGAASMWPLLSQIIPAKMVATGYGTMTAVQNLGLSTIPLLISWIQSLDGIKGTNHQYGVPILIFIGCVASAAILAAKLFFVDRSGTGKLNASAEERRAIAEAEEAAASAEAYKTLGDHDDLNLHYDN